jgi:hypothetical protein
LFLCTVVCGSSLPLCYIKHKPTIHFSWCPSVSKPLFSIILFLSWSSVLSSVYVSFPQLLLKLLYNLCELCHIVIFLGCDYRQDLDWWLDLLTTYTHHLEIQVITALSLISTLYKSPQHQLSFFPTCYAPIASLALKLIYCWFRCSITDPDLFSHLGR